MMNLFFDLDGTLIDSRMRLYSLFCDLTGQEILDFESYWELKRSNHSQHWILSTILNYNEEQITSFRQQWLAQIEKEEYLQFDSLFPYTLRTLEELRLSGNALYIVTSRQHRASTLQQLVQLGLSEYFKDCLIASPPKTKTDEIRLLGIPTGTSDFVIGDTPEDILTAKNLKMQSIAVFSGFYNMAELLAQEPDFITADISRIPAYLKNT